MTDNIKVREPKLEPKDGTNLGERERNRTAGIDGDYNFQKIPELNSPEYEVVIKGPYASHIALGADRLNPSPHKDVKYGDGKGGQGVFACSHIDLVAGLDSVDTFKGKVPTVPVNPDAFRDASRVYISENCDIDRLFELSAGSIGSVENKAAIAVKSDNVRIIGRESIKIVSSTDIYNSKGRKMRSVGGIDLIAGNIPTMAVGGVPLKLKSGEDVLQPLVRGLHLRNCLQEIMGRIDVVYATIDSHIKAQQKFNDMVMQHTHPDFIAKAMGTLAASNPNAYFGGEVGPSLKLQTSGAELFAKVLKLKTDIKFGSMLFAAIELEYLNPVGGSYINSRGVRTS